MPLPKCKVSSEKLHLSVLGRILHKVLGHGCLAAATFSLFGNTSIHWESLHVYPAHRERDIDCGTVHSPGETLLEEHLLLSSLGPSGVPNHILYL